MNALDLAYSLAVVLAAPVWARKTRGGWRQRFGHIDPLPTATRPRIMLHAVSVGETNALRSLVPLLTPHADVLVTASTDTGLARATELYTAAAHVRRYPLDFSASVARFLDTAKPDLVALVELELWPNLVRACRERNIPICVINGRLSERSFKGYRRIRRFIAPSFGSLNFAAVQNTEYAQRFEFMGVPPNRCLVTGSMKFDVGSTPAAQATASPPQAALDLAIAMGIDLSRPLIVAGSTAPGEHELLHAATPPGVQLLCAPRRPEWFDQAAAALPGCTRRSAPRAAEKAQARPSDRFLLDSIGELRNAYALADVVVIGRSFGDLFGSDPIEPIALGKPTLIGPAVSDFRHIVEALDAAKGVLRTTSEQLASDLAQVLSDKQFAATLATRGQACIAANRGASERHANLLLNQVSSQAARH
jgi:3-deoxy-D-manno-octulosonic-acid transferase